MRSEDHWSIGKFGFILLLLVFVSPPIFSSEKLSIETPGAEIFFERSGNPEGPPWLLIHGFGQSWEAWKGSADFLESKGFDVWKINLRGHGRSHFISLAKNPVRNSFTTEALFSDIEPVVDQIVKKTGKKITIAGHSLGALLAQFYLSGGHVVNGKIRLNNQAAKKIALTKVERFVSIGAPYFLDDPGQKPSLEFLANVQPLLGIRSDIPGLIRSLVDAAVMMNPLNRKTLGVFLKGLVNPDSLTLGEAGELINRGLEPIPEALAESLLSYVRKGHFFIGKNRAGEPANPMYVPTIMVTGGKDELAPLESVARRAATRFSPAPITEVLLPDKSHVDLIMGNAASQTFEAVLEAISDAEKSLPLIVGGNICRALF